MSKLEKAAIAAQTVLGEYSLSANASKAAPIFHMGTTTTYNRFLEAQIKDSLGVLSPRHYWLEFAAKSALITVKRK
jgi:hypothetical protein